VILHLIYLLAVFGISRIKVDPEKDKFLDHLKKYFKWNGWVMLYYLLFTSLALDAALQIRSFDDSNILNIIVKK